MTPLYRHYDAAGTLLCVGTRRRSPADTVRTEMRQFATEMDAAIALALAIRDEKPALIDMKRAEPTSMLTARIPTTLFDRLKAIANRSKFIRDALEKALDGR